MELIVVEQSVVEQPASPAIILNDAVTCAASEVGQALKAGNVTVALHTGLQALDDGVTRTSTAIGGTLADAVGVEATKNEKTLAGATVFLGIAGALVGAGAYVWARAWRAVEKERAEEEEEENAVARK